MIEKITNKYVIATLDNPTQYLQSLHWGRYQFGDIECATKFNGMKLAKEIIAYYRHDTNDLSDLVIVPVKITWELIEEEKE